MMTNAHADHVRTEPRGDGPGDARRDGRPSGPGQGRGWSSAIPSWLAAPLFVAATAPPWAIVVAWLWLHGDRAATLALAIVAAAGYRAAVAQCLRARAAGPAPWRRALRKRGFIFATAWIVCGAVVLPPVVFGLLLVATIVAWLFLRRDRTRRSAANCWGS